MIMTTTTTVGIETLPEECRLHIFRYLESIDLGEVSCTCKLFQHDCCRSQHEVLSQHRTIVLKIKKNSRRKKMVRAIRQIFYLAERDKGVVKNLLHMDEIIKKFDTNLKMRKAATTTRDEKKFTKLKFLYPENETSHVPLYLMRNFEHFSYPSITSLDVSSSFLKRSCCRDHGINSREEQNKRKQRRVREVVVAEIREHYSHSVAFDCASLCNLLQMFPNLIDIDMSNLRVFDSFTELGPVRLPFGDIRSLTWNQSDCQIWMTGSDLSWFPVLSELFLDNSILFMPEYIKASNCGYDLVGLFCHCAAPLTKVSIKNLKVKLPPRGGSLTVRVTDAMIIKFIRSTPTLTWLRSDLISNPTDKTINYKELFQQERPNLILL